MTNREHPFYYSLNFKIIALLVALTLIPLIINVYIWHSLTLEAAESEAIETTHHVLGVSNDIFETAIRDTYGIVSMLTVDHTGRVSELLNKDFDNPEEEYRNTRELESYIASISGGARSYYSGISIISSNKETINFGVSPPYEGEYLSHYWDTLQMEETKRLITPPHHFSEINHQGTFRYNDMVLSIVRPVFYAGEFKGVISGNVWCNLLIDIFDNVVENDTKIIIFDKGVNEVYFSSDDQEVPTFDNNTFIQSSLSNIDASKGDFYTTIDGLDYLCVYTDSDYTNWTTLAFIPRDSLLEGYNQTSRQAFFITIFFSLTAIVSGVFLATYTTKNIRTLNQTMLSVHENNLEIDVEIKSRDEIGYLFKQYKSMLMRIKNLIQNVKEEEANKRKYEIQALQSQINPHFLYNTLNSIKFLASMQGIENIQTVSEGLSEILHTYMDNSTVFLTIDKELNLLNQYSLIQSYRYTNTFTLDINVDDQLSNHMIPKLLLQPLVENSIVHGFQHKAINGTIWLSIHSKNDAEITIKVIDNGSGFDEKKVQSLLAQPEPNDHIGILNVHRRLQRYFGSQHGLQAYIDDRGYSVFELDIPKILEKEVNDYV